MKAKRAGSPIAGNRYAWRDGVHLPVAAQDFGEWVMTLPDREPATIVRHARDMGSVAHRLFNWDDESAAHEQRLIVARKLYGCLVVDAVIYRDNKPVTIQVAAIVKGGRDEPYEPIAKVMGNSEKRRYRLAKCLRELTIVRREYAALSELAVVFAEIDAASQRHQRGRQRADRTARRAGASPG